MSIEQASNPQCPHGHNGIACQACDIESACAYLERAVCRNADAFEDADGDRTPNCQCVECGHIRAVIAAARASEGRRVQLERVGEERRTEWIRAEQAEAERDATQRECLRLMGKLEQAEGNVNQLSEYTHHSEWCLSPASGWTAPCNCGLSKLLEGE